MWSRLDPEALEGLGERRRGHPAPCGTSSQRVRRPDLGVVARADDDRLTLEPGRRRAGTAGMRTRPCRSSSASTPPAKMNRWKSRDRWSVIGSARDLVGQGVPAGAGVDREAAVDPARDDRAASSCARNFDGTAIRPLSSTECRYSPVNTCRGSPVGPRTGLPPGRLGGSPPLPTFRHFVPLGCIVRHRNHPSMGEMHHGSGCGFRLAAAARGRGGASRRRRLAGAVCGGGSATNRFCHLHPGGVRVTALEAMPPDAYRGLAQAGYFCLTIRSRSCGRSDSYTGEA